MTAVGIGVGAVFVVSPWAGGASSSSVFGLAPVAESEAVTDDPGTYELGMQFQVSEAGRITGLMYWRSAADADDEDTRTMYLWDSAGTPLGNVQIVSGVGNSGWQIGTLSSPIEVTTGNTYVVTYGTTANYTATANYFTSAQSSFDGRVTAPATGAVTGGNGVFYSGATATFPNQTFNATNYWADVEFRRGIPTVLSNFAYMEGEGQSLMVAGFNNIDDLPASDRTTPYLNTFGMSTADGTVATQAKPLDWYAYGLLLTGESDGNGLNGPLTEREISSGSTTGIGYTAGVARAYRDGDLWNTTADALYMAKFASPGKHIDEFIPRLGGDVFTLKTYGRRELRDWLNNGITDTSVFVQVQLWAQGEANTTQPRIDANLSHPDITDYNAELREVIAYDSEQLGVDPIRIFFQLKQIQDASSPTTVDPYTVAINDETKKLCRYTINTASGTGAFASITDNGTANGELPNCYFLEHDLQRLQNQDPHLTSTSTMALGEAAADALVSILGGEGWTSTYQIADVAPVVITFETGTLTDTTIPVNCIVSDDGTLYAAAVPAGSSAPTVDEVIAGSGGGIVGTGTNTVNASPQSGSAITSNATITGLTAVTSYDVYLAYVERDHGSKSRVLKSIANVTTASAVATTPGWDDTFEVSQTAYSGTNNTIATRTVQATDYIRGNTDSILSSGKRYFEMTMTGSTNTAFAGIGSTSAGGGGGPGGDRTLTVGLRFATVVWSPDQSLAVDPGVSGGVDYEVRVAVDTATEEFWIKILKGGSELDWNGSASADPATGVGGLSYSGVTGDVVPMISLFSNGCVATLKPKSADWTYSAPTGFSEL